MAQQWEEVRLENQDLPSYHEHTLVIWIQSADSHTGQQHHVVQTDDSTDRSPTQIFCVRLSGRPQMANVDSTFKEQVLHAQRKADRYHHH